VVDTALTTDSPAARLVGNQQYNLSSIDFSRLRAEFERTPYKNVVILNLKEQIEKRLAMMLARNPTRVDLYERYQEIVKDYNKDKDAAEIQKVLDDLTATMGSLDEEGKRYLREGLQNEGQLAVFDLLQKESLSKGERESVKKIAVDLLAKLNSGQIQIQRLREMATVQAKVKAEIIKHLFANLPSDVYDTDEISLKANVLFARNYSARF
jgi:type I restriction enzyme R subunit